MKSLLRCCFSLVVALPGVCGAAAPPSYLLAGPEEIAGARRKADKYAWARRALDAALRDADAALARPLEIPSRGGQWPHWYSCKRDGVRLETVTPTRHRCPKCGQVYTGDPYDAVVLYGEHSRWSRAARDLGLAYRLTGRTVYAARAGEILAAYAGRYRSYRLHNTRGEEKVGGGRIMAQTLDESVWLIPAAFGYALVREALSAGRRKHIEEDLFVAAADVIREHRMGIHNIQCWKNSAVGLAGFVAGREDLVREAIDDPERGFRAQIARGVTEDGLWWEGSLGYHRYTMQALWPLAEAARRAGIDLYSDRYRSVFDAPLALSLPNGDSPGFADNAGGNIRAAAPLYELAYARWGRPEYGRVAAASSRESLEALLYGAETVPAGPLIPEASVLLAGAGFAVLRSPAMTAAVRFGRHGGGHGHPDKLNLVTFGAGKQGGLDPGSINYGVPLHAEWYKSTIAHNTVAVDLSNQAAVDGRLGEWSAGKDAAVFSGTAAEAYPGVTLRRSLRLDGRSLEDRFECESKAVHTYDWAFHAPGRLSLSTALEAASGALGGAGGYQHIRAGGRARTSAGFTATWSEPDARLTIRFRGAPDTELIVGEGPGRDPAEPVALLIVRRRAARTVFEATHEFAKLP